MAEPTQLQKETVTQIEDEGEDPTRDYDTLHYWEDGRLIETYRHLSRDLRQRDFNERTVHRMGRVEEELRDHDLDPNEIAREVEEWLR